MSSDLLKVGHSTAVEKGSRGEQTCKIGSLKMLQRGRRGDFLVAADQRRSSSTSFLGKKMIFCRKNAQESLRIFTNEDIGKCAGTSVLATLSL